MRIICITGAVLGISLVLASAALGDTLGQMLYYPIKGLTGAAFVHGPGMSAFLSPGWASVGSDCNGAVLHDKKHRVPKYASRVFIRNKILTSGCSYSLAMGVWYDNKQFDALPLPAGSVRRSYARQRRASMRESCRRAQSTVRKGEPPRNRGYVPCSRLRYVNGTANQHVTLHYHCRAGQPHAARRIMLIHRSQNGRLELLKFRRRNCNRHVKEIQVFSGIWSYKRPDRKHRKH
jgi:hypothetical protein